MRNLSRAPLHARRSPFGPGEKLWVSGWIRPISCVYSGGSIVHNHGCPLSLLLKVQVTGDIYAHSPVEKSNFLNIK